MASLCSTACAGVSNPPAAYDAACTIETRRYGSNYFCLVKCDETVDITLAANVNTAVTAGIIALSPLGKLIVQPEEQTVIESATGCGQDIAVGSTTDITFETYQTDGCDGITDFTYWYDLRENYLKYRIFWVDCCGIIFYDEGASNPGYAFTMPKLPTWEEGEEGYGKWSMTFQISHTSGFGVLLDDTVTDELGISVS